MLGITNACNTRTTKTTVDSNTIFLFTDSLTEKTGNCTFTNNDVIVSTTQKRDGRNTLYFSRLKPAYLQATMASLPTSLNTALSGTNQWTFECWFFLLTEGLSQTCLIHFKNISSAAYGILLGHYGSHVNADIYVSSNNSSWNVLSNTALWNSLDCGTWNHLAVVRGTNGVIKGFCNGINTYTSAAISTSFFTPTDGLVTIGGYVGGANTAAVTCLYGYFQDIRFSNTARYSTNFTPPQRFL